MGVSMSSIYNNQDSIAAKFMKAALYKKHAATLTKRRMYSSFHNLQNHARRSGWSRDTSPEGITEKQMLGYVRARLDHGIASRTVHNELSHFRRALKAVMRHEFAMRVCGSRALGVPRASRIGKGLAISNIDFELAMQRASGVTRALLGLQRSLGLRIREALCSGDCLHLWLKDLENGCKSLHVTRGTKGGRGRYIFIRPDNFQTVIESVKAAIEFLDRNDGKLVSSTCLRTALDKHTYRLAKIGICGPKSTRSLRRAFALDQFNYYLNIGNSENIALMLVSRDLGHGDKRQTFIYNSYLRATLEAQGKGLSKFSVRKVSKKG